MTEQTQPIEPKTPEQLIQELEEIKKQRDEYLAGWQRERADLLNHKKDEVERMKELMAYATEEFLLRMFPILDNLNLAIQAVAKKMPENEKEKGIAQGFLQIGSQIQEFLKSQGIEEVKTEGKFNPEFHESIQEVEANGKESGTIIEVAEKGYTLGSKLLRPAKVKIAK